LPVFLIAFVVLSIIAAALVSFLKESELIKAAKDKQW
jgi:hypothetical protein